MAIATVIQRPQAHAPQKDEPAVVRRRPKATKRARNSTREAPQKRDEPGLTRQDAPVVDPTGYLCRNWLSFEARPALTLNPDAGPGELLAWSWAEVRALGLTVRALHALLQDDALAFDPETLEELLSHRLAPLEAVLKHVVDRLDADARSAEKLRE